ncbi:hypothetical protein ED733_002028 [Metarhizium rileyi]|uniref:Chitinase n=1 Tax=Metarhizium rileyi (strain RCEF 4871) TaxID=1649241 RepID=A0A5C6G0Q6_METRR|nr:hypothetical protein ED733_002028 [Metarhizium rileyi]
MDLSFGGTPGVGDFPSLAGIHAIWGSMDTTRLAEVCDAGVSYVTISMAPNHGSYEYDGYRNFALLCYATALGYDNDVVSEERNLQACDAMFKDIEYCHGQNVKVLLGIGKEFGQIAYKLLGKDNFFYGLHMFMDEDISDSVHAYDHWALTIQKFRNLRSNLFIAATPSCTIGNQNDVLRDYQIDSLFVPFKYASCDSWNDQHVQNRLTVDNVLSNWRQRIVDGESKQAMLFITLNPPELNTAKTQPERPAEWLCKYQDKNDNLLGFFLEDSPPPPIL